MVFISRLISICNSSHLAKPTNLLLAERRVGKSLTLPILSLVLGVLFTLMGFIKLTPTLSVEIHREIRRQFVAFVRAGPLISYLGLHPSVQSYRLLVGWCELSGGLLLIVSRGTLQLTSNLAMLVVSLNSVYDHLYSKDKSDSIDIVPSAVLTLMLSCRLIVEYQVFLRVRKEFQRLNNLEEHKTKKTN